MDHFVLAISKFRRQRYEQCIEMCDEMLQRNPQDQAAWLLKCRALTRQSYIDDLEIDEEGVADILMVQTDDNALATAPRPGTSFQRPLSSANNGGISQMVRPMSNGRPVSGYMRPGTNRPVTGSSRGALQSALQGARPGTTRPVSSGGRVLRLGTASMIQQGGQFIMADKINAKNTAKRKHLAKAIVDYLIYVENNFRRALDISAEATMLTNYEDWWWKERIGKCYFKLGLIKDAEKQFLSSLKNQDMIITHLELAKVSIRLDQPARSIDLYNAAIEKFPYEVHLINGIARVHDMLNDPMKAVTFYKKILIFDNSSIEAIASLASYHFYTDQPEIALRFYRRLIQSGVINAELWNNLGLCCFYAAQYDMALSCFERALTLSDDTNLADIWYNVGHIAIGIGDLGLSYQAFKIAVSSNPSHAESFNNLGVLELRKGNVEQAKSNFQQAAKLAEFLFEPCYNAALLMLKKGDFQESYQMIRKSLEIFPEHADSKELLKNLNQHFSAL